MKSNNYTIFSQQFNDISHPWRQKNREPLPTALYPISRYSGARYKGGSLYVEQFYNVDSSLPIRMAQTLTVKHVSLPPFERVQVNEPTFTKPTVT